LGDQKDQQQLLNHAKRVSNAAIEQAEVAQELIDNNPFASGFSEEALSRMLAEKSSAVHDACNNLVAFSKNALEASTERVNFLRAKMTEIDAALEESNNPFANLNTSATVDDVERLAQQLSSVSSLIVMASHGQYHKVVETVEKSLPLVRSLLSAAKGIQATCTRYPESTGPALDHSRKAAKCLKELISTISRAVGQGSLTHPVGLERQINEEARDVQGQTSRIVEQTRSIKSKQASYEEEQKRERAAAARRASDAASAPLPPPAVVQLPPPVQQPVFTPTPAVATFGTAGATSSSATATGQDFDLATSDGLKSAMNALAAAAARLKTTRQGSPAEVRRKALKRSGIHSTKEGLDLNVIVMNATGDVAGALRQLLNAARMAQDQRIENNRAGVNKDEVYHRDPTWSEGVVSAAKSVVGTMEQLIEASTSKDLDDDLIVTLARGVSSSTAQLVAAERVRGDPDSEATKFLLISARGVANATTELINKTREATQVSNVPRPALRADGKAVEADPALASTNDKVKELETALRITRLEKELAAARNEMTGMRKERYQ